MRPTTTPSASTSKSSLLHSPHLTIILSFGPLARLDRRFLPLLYNRRHFGVLTFFVVRRSQRSVHRALWPILALAVALGLAMALALRAPPEVQAPQATEGLKP